MAGDQREVGQRLHVLDQRRRGRARRARRPAPLVPGYRRPPVDRGDDRGLLAGDERVRGDHVLDRDPVPAGVAAAGERSAADPRGRRARRGAPSGPRRPPAADVAGRPGPGAGRWASRVRSLALAGSPSAALAITTGRRPAATAASLRSVGKPAPPRPVSPASRDGRRSGARAPGSGPCGAGVVVESGPGGRQQAAVSGRGLRTGAGQARGHRDRPCGAGGSGGRGAARCAAERSVKPV